MSRPSSRTCRCACRNRYRAGPAENSTNRIRIRSSERFLKNTIWPKPYHPLKARRLLASSRCHRHICRARRRGRCRRAAYDGATLAYRSEYGIGIASRETWRWYRAFEKANRRPPIIVRVSDSRGKRKTEAKAARRLMTLTGSCSLSRRGRKTRLELIMLQWPRRKTVQYHARWEMRRRRLLSLHQRGGQLPTLPRCWPGRSIGVLRPTRVDTPRACCASGGVFVRQARRAPLRPRLHRRARNPTPRKCLLQR